MITLYHGTNVDIDVVDLSRSKRGKDFGCGFYLNANYDQAYEMAVRTTRIAEQPESSRRVNAFAFDDDILDKCSDLKIKIFTDYTEEWAEFVVMNRRNKTSVQAHDYDIVIGPIADDTVGVQIRRYMMGYLSAADLVEELRFSGDHAVQYFFGTEKALKYLKKI